ncbi:MAG: glucose-1-phosphate cytidylyltransferase [Phycisphaerales bacterium]|nr:glucose-1-phosphate cytidylyltransferase [Phycisphaerales bacterium]
MKVAILAGGIGSRLSEETVVRPKPMVEIGDYPILWHIMRHYRTYGHKQFVVALGYKGEVIKRYFVDKAQLQGNISVNLQTGSYQRQPELVDDFSVELIETGAKTNTGGRVKRLAPWLGNSTFMLTWGDGVSNVNLDELLAFHRRHGKLLTVTAVRPPARFGHLVFDGDQIIDFDEKPDTGEGWINGAFFVAEPGVLEYIDGDESSWEHGPMRTLARQGQLMAYRHNGFWQCMDTLRERQLLQELWSSGKAPWKIW